MERITIVEEPESFGFRYLIIVLITKVNVKMDITVVVCRVKPIDCCVFTNIWKDARVPRMKDSVS